MSTARVFPEFRGIVTNFAFNLIWNLGRGSSQGCKKKTFSQTKNEWKLISSTKWIWKPNFNSLLPALPTRLRGNCSSGYMNPDAPLHVMQQRFCSKTRRLLCVLFLWFSQVFRWTKLLVNRIKLRLYF